MTLKTHQPPMSIQEQIDNLKNLGLSIENEGFATNFLNDVSYFRFIKAYSLGLKVKNGSYNANTTFNQLVELYLFNANFRHLLFKEIEKVEVNLRCRLSNYFSAAHGILGYKDANNFTNSAFHAKFILDVEKE